MPEHSDWEVQKAVYARLSSVSAVTDLLAQGEDSVCDHVLSGSAFPYIAFGAMQSEPLETAAAGGRDILLTLHVFSRQPGFKETRAVMAAVHAALHDADFSVTGQNLVLCLETGSETVLEQDGETRRGTMRFRILTEPSS